MDSNLLTIKPATPADIPLLLTLIKELAQYEKLLHEVVATETDLQESLFGTHRAAEVIFGYFEEKPVSFAIFFHSFTSFLGRPGLYLEDLYVKPEARAKGFAQQMLAYLAHLAIQRGCKRLEWSVLDWNELAIGFYRKIGAIPMNDWTVFRLTGDPLLRLGKSHTSAY